MAWSFFKSKNDDELPKNKVVEIPVDQIIPNRYQPRKEFSAASIQELADTIKEHGLLQPIVLRQYKPEHYEIIAGERRFRAVNALGWEKVPAIVKKMSDSEAASMAVIENLQREGLTAIEEAQAYQRLMDINQMTQFELGKLIGKSQSFVGNKMRLLKLAPAVKRVMLKREITERHGRALVGLPEDQQVEVMKKIIADHLSVKETEKMVRKLHHPEEFAEEDQDAGPADKPKKARKPKAKKRVRGQAHDARLAINTVHKSLKLIADSGLEVKTSEEDGPGYHRIVIDIPVNEEKSKK